MQDCAVCCAIGLIHHRCCCLLLVGTGGCLCLSCQMLKPLQNLQLNLHFSSESIRHNSTSHCYPLEKPISQCHGGILSEGRPGCFLFFKFFPEHSSPSSCSFWHSCGERRERIEQCERRKQSTQDPPNGVVVCYSK